MRHLITLSLVFTAAVSFGQKFYGMTQIEDNLWMDETEITNNEYAQFLKAISDEDSAKHAPDVSLIYAVDSSLGEYYFTHPAYDNHPVVGITYENAMAFCEWRTSFFNSDSGKDYKVTFTLPTSEQWNKEAAKGDFGGMYIGTITHPTQPTHKKEKKFMDKNLYLVNCKESNKNLWDNKSIYGPSVPFAQDAEKQFGVGEILGLAGNVAEMTLDKKVLGGSFFHSLDKCKIGETIDHDPSNAAIWMGFRCVVSINK